MKNGSPESLGFKRLWQAAAAGTSAGSELATLLDQLDKSEEALPNLSAILAFNPNSLKVLEGVDRSRRQTGGPLQANRLKEDHTCR